MSEPDRPDSVEPDRPEGDGDRATPPMKDAGVSLAARTRALVGIVGLCWTAFAVSALTVSKRVFGLTAVGVVSSAALYLLVRRNPSVARVAAHLTLLISIVMLAGFAMITGYTRAPAIWYFVCVPLFASYVLGQRAAIGWTLVSAAAIGGVELSRRYFPVTNEYLVSEGGLWHRIILLVVVVLAFKTVTTRVHTNQLAELEHREAEVRSLLDGLSKKNEELLNARDTALAASRAKGDFLAMMSHEIRTPLNAVLGLAGVLLDAPLASEQREIVRTIRSSGDSLLLLLNDILDFSKIEAGRLQLERAPFDVVDCAEDALDLFSAVAHEKGLDLSCHVSSDVPGRVEGDSGRVRQILVNLVSNAIKFTLRGSVQVHVDAEPVSHGDGEPDMRIHCAVRDTGIGIPADHLATLFRPFSQLDASTTRRFGGTGLGLAICRTLAERMGGKVWAESKKGAGSTFHFTFVARSLAAFSSSEVSHNGEQGALVLSPRPGTRASVASQLTALGLPMVACASIDELPEALASLRPDVVIVDDSLPPPELHEALSRMHRPPVLVLLSTAGRDTVARREVREKWGPEPVIVTLPVRRVALREAVFHALGLDETPLPRSSGVPPLAMDLPLRILIAEDNPVNQRVALLLLERLGYRADVVGNGAEAIEAVRAHPYDVVLMDVRMPEIDGIEATRRIRGELPRDRQPRIVALTANAMTEDRQVCEDAGMDDFLSKPVTAKELERALRGGSRPRISLPPRDSALGSQEIDALRRLTAGAPEVMQQLIDDYIASALRLVASIQDAASRGDAKALEQAAHSLKGSSGQMGAQQLMAESAAMEKAAAAGDFAIVRERLPALLKKHESALEKLAALRETTGSA